MVLYARVDVAPSLYERTLVEALPEASIKPLHCEFVLRLALVKPCPSTSVLGLRITEPEKPSNG
jgi:hypothetical protein